MSSSIGPMQAALMDVGFCMVGHLIKVGSCEGS